MELGNWMTIKEFMAKNGIKSRKTIYNMIGDGRLDMKKILDRTVIKPAA